MADSTAARTQHVTLTADTHHAVELTGPGRVVELAHHGNNSNVVYFKLFAEDPDDVITSAGDDCDVLLAGERITVNGPQRKGGSMFVELLSAGTPTVSVTILQAGN